jgi:cytochrome P450
MTTDTLTPAAPGGFDPFSQEFLADPHAFWQTTQDRPVFFYEPLHCWVISGHENVARALRDWQTFSSATLRVVPLPPASKERVPADLQELLAELMEKAIINIDPPEHTVHRKALQKAFTRPLIAEYEPAIRQLANELIDEFAASGSCDLMADYCHRLTIGVLIKMIGLPQEALPRFRNWIDDILGLMTLQRFDGGDDAEMQLPAPIDVLEQRYLRVGDAYPFFKAYLDERREHPTDDLTSAMILAKNDDGTPAMSYVHILGHMLGLAVAGSETTANLIGQMVRVFSANPDVLQEVLDNPELWDAAIEEGLRRLAIAGSLMRVTTADVEIGGVTIPARTPVLVNIAGGNSDASVFPDPLKFDLHRENAEDHIAFGLGRHFCSGAPLARLEAKAALQELYARIPDIHADPDQTVAYKPAVTTRVLEGLQASWKA